MDLTNIKHGQDKSRKVGRRVNEGLAFGWNEAYFEKFHDVDL